jgi:demethylmenaquinone methyltransferase/2-methoxy-6-polyprenyl-1,4-benzoquinol methylase
MTPPASSSSEPVWTARDLEEGPHGTADKAHRVERMFAAIAHRYDLNNRVHSFGRDQAWRRAAVRMCDVTAADDVLDVACGTGDLTEAFADARPASVTGLDFTQEMLDLASVKAAGRRRAEGVPAPTYVKGDAMALPFADGAFSVVSIAFGIRNVAEPPLAMAEFRRVLRPGGRLVILEFSRPANPVLRTLNDLYTLRVMPFTATLVARDRSGAYRYLPRSIHTFPDRGELAGMISAAGFGGVEQRPMTFGVCMAYLARVDGEAVGDQPSAGSKADHSG